MGLVQAAELHLTDETPFVANNSIGTPIMATSNNNNEVIVTATGRALNAYITGGNLVVTTSPPVANNSTTNAPTSLGIAGNQGLAANANRVRYIVQDLAATIPIYVLHGNNSNNANSSLFTYILYPGSQSKDGFGERREDTIWKGAVQWAAANNGGLGVIQEETV